MVDFLKRLDEGFGVSVKGLLSLTPGNTPDGRLTVPQQARMETGPSTLAVKEV